MSLFIKEVHVLDIWKIMGMNFWQCWLRNHGKMIIRLKIWIFLTWVDWQWLTMANHDSPWLTMDNYDKPWFTMVYYMVNHGILHGISWFTMAYHGRTGGQTSDRTDSRTVVQTIPTSIPQKQKHTNRALGLEANK